MTYFPEIFGTSGYAVLESVTPEFQDRRDWNIFETEIPGSKFMLHSGSRAWEASYILDLNL